MKKALLPGALGLLLLLAFGAAGDLIFMRPGSFRTAREAVEDGTNAPNWTVEPQFKKDVFTFTRVQYTVDNSRRYGYGNDPETRWGTDFPDSDINFSWRLQQVTSMKVDPDCRVLKLTDKDLFSYPFLYIVEPGRLTIQDDELPILRRYLLNGGFLMFDDFWGPREWRNFENEMKLLFPDRPIEDLPPTHPIFSFVVPLKEPPQVPGLPHFEMGRDRDTKALGEDAHFRGIFDDKRRLMVMICHNTDMGDGWEREGENLDRKSVV